MVTFLFQGTPGTNHEPSDKPREESIASRLTPDGHVEMNYVEENSIPYYGGLFLNILEIKCVLTVKEGPGLHR